MTLHESFEFGPSLRLIQKYKQYSKTSATSNASQSERSMKLGMRLQFSTFGRPTPFQYAGREKSVPGSNPLMLHIVQVPGPTAYQLNPEANSFSPASTQTETCPPSQVHLSNNKSSKLRGGATSFCPGVPIYFEFDQEACTFMPDMRLESTFCAKGHMLHLTSTYSSPSVESGSRSSPNIAHQYSTLSAPAAILLSLEASKLNESTSESLSPTKNLLDHISDTGTFTGLNNCTISNDNNSCAFRDTDVEEASHASTTDAVWSPEDEQVAHLAVPSDALLAQNTERERMEVDYAPENLESLTPEQELENYRRSFDLDVPFVHHYNWLNQDVYIPSSTKPATSLAIIMSRPKHSDRFNEDAVCYRKQVLIKRAFRYVDPVIYKGDHESLKLRGSALEDAAIGCTAKFYSQHGTWGRSKLNDDDDMPAVDALDTDDYEDDIVFNGVTVDCNFPTKERFQRAAAVNMYQEIQEAQLLIEMRRRQRTGKNISKSPLYQVWNIRDLRYDTGFDWSEEADEMDDLPAVDYKQVIKDLCRAQTEITAEHGSTDLTADPAPLPLECELVDAPVLSPR